MENTNSLINTVAALGADITYSNGNLNIAVDSGTFPQMFVPQVDSFTKITGVAETSQTSTVTYAVANSTTYELVITQSINAPNQAPATYTASYTSDANATDAEIATNLVNQINAQTGETGIKVTASGAASPLTLTADAGFPFFTASAVSNVTIAAGVTGVAAKGIGADLVTAGVAGAVVGTTYTTYIFDFYSNQPAQMGAELNAGLNTMTLYVNQGDADFGLFDAQLRAIINSEKVTLISNSTSPRLFAIGGLVPAVSTDFTDATPVNAGGATAEVYIGEIQVSSNCLVTGVAVFNGSNVTDNIKVGLANSAGAVVATSVSTVGAGADAYQLVPFTATYFAVPGTYYILSMYAAGTSRYNAPPLGAFGASKQTGQTFTTGFTTITPPTTFTANLCNIASLY
jgi:hypothetical protein